MKIGLLLTKSVIYPSMGFDIIDGLKASLKNQGQESEYEIIAKNIGVGGNNDDIYSNAEQLLLEGADIVIGYINPHAAEAISTLFESSGKTLLVLDSGYHLPVYESVLPNTYFISLQGNLCSRAIVNKAFSDGNKNFALACSFFDAGYRSPYIYSAASEEKGGAVTFNHVTPLRKVDFTLDPLVNYLNENKDTAIFVSFCGDMTEDYLNESAKLESLSKNNTYASGFTAEENWLDKITYPGYDWYSAVPWSKNIDTPANNEFKNIMGSIRPEKINIFSLLGWEAALYISKSDNFNFDGLIIDSPRGNVFMNPSTKHSEAPVYYATVTKNIDTNTCVLTNITEESDLTEDRNGLLKDIEYIKNNISNSWLNSYACLDS
ncbi:ABC transporter substrate-binding protein [Flavobacterium beibuense]|nr:ABC transporter substrate-binding protein [Flavobacterium beibuense]